MTGGAPRVAHFLHRFDSNAICRRTPGRSQTVFASSSTGQVSVSAPSSGTVWRRWLPRSFRCGTGTSSFHSPPAREAFGLGDSISATSSRMQSLARYQPDALPRPFNTAVPRMRKHRFPMIVGSAMCGEVSKHAPVSSRANRYCSSMTSPLPVLRAQPREERFSTLARARWISSPLLGARRGANTARRYTAESVEDTGTEGEIRAKNQIKNHVLNRTTIRWCFSFNPFKVTSAVV